MVAEQIGLDLPAVGHLLERVRAKGRGELFKTVLPMEGRSPLKGTMSEQVLKESSPFLADQGAKLFFTGTEMFVNFTLFSQPVG